MDLKNVLDVEEVVNFIVNIVLVKKEIVIASTIVLRFQIDLNMKKEV